ncbi:MAG: patatin-like phospholipase family protein [Prolixibacteraceae bacterium]
MKNALFLTGAAARISQEVAILDKLQELHGLEITEKNTMLAGFSSGALNITALNACFRTKNPLSWNNYYKEEILFKITSKKVYQRKKFIPLDTTPLQKTIGGFLADSNMSTLNNFSFQTFILAFSYLRLSTLWVSNLYNRHQTIKLLDLMMATTAIPILFPDQNIRNDEAKHNKYLRGRFADGGAGGSFKRFEYHIKKYLRQNEQLDKIYIISPMREVTDSDYDELYQMIPSVEIFKMELKDIRLLKLFLEMISQNGFDTFIKRFYKWTKKRNIANEIYICIPQMKSNYPILNFNKQREQYEDVCTWADQNPQQLAIPIGEYVKRFETKPLMKFTNKWQRKLKHRLRSIWINR